MLTPQSIKDQEFQTKFRGYEPIEVKAYLELLAEDFFELTEENRIQAEEIETLLIEKEALLKGKEALTNEVKISQENAEGVHAKIQENSKHKDQEIADLKIQFDNMTKTTASLEEENAAYLEEIAGLEEALTSGEGSSLQGQAELTKLRDKIELLEEKNKELKQEGVDFKTTILAAQKFADSLRQSGQEEAEKILSEAHAEIEKFRNAAEAELARLPKEIEDLKQKKMKVRKDLEKTLYAYLEGLEVQSEGDSAANEDDVADLFQRIQLPDDEKIDPDVIDKTKNDRT